MWHWYLLAYIAGFISAYVVALIILWAWDKITRPGRIRDRGE